MLRCSGYIGTRYSQIQSLLLIVFCLFVVAWHGTRIWRRSMGSVIYPLFCGFTATFPHTFSLCPTSGLAVSLWQFEMRMYCWSCCYIWRCLCRACLSRCRSSPKRNWNIKTIFFLLFLLLLSIRRPFCWRFCRQILVFFFLQCFVFFFFSTCCSKSRVEKFRQRSVANEFPLLRHWA